MRKLLFITLVFLYSCQLHYHDNNIFVTVKKINKENIVNDKFYVISSERKIGHVIFINYNEYLFDHPRQLEILFTDTVTIELYESSTSYYELVQIIE